MYKHFYNKSSETNLNINMNTSSSTLGPVYSSSESKSKSRCHTALMLEVPLILYAILHCIAATIGLILLTSSNDFLYTTQEEIELVTVGSIGCVTSCLALLAVWMRVRSLLVPFILFLLFTIILDSISIFAYFTHKENIDLENRDFVSEAIIKYSADLVLFTALKLVFSIIIFQITVQTYRRNLKLRGGRSPFRIGNKTCSNDKERLAASPKLAEKKNSRFNYAQFGYVQEM